MQLDLEAASQKFATKLTDLLAGTLPEAPLIVAQRASGRYVLKPDTDDGQVQLKIGGRHVADLRFQFFQELDRTGTYLKTAKSHFTVTSVSDREPLFRLDYDAAYSRATSHWQIHAERGAFSELLTHAQLAKNVNVTPHSISKLHIPTGGERFRPGLEDFLEFLIKECGVDAVEGWRKSIEEHRKGWRLLQFRTAVRELPEEAAEVLRREGWSVEAPKDGAPDPWLKPYRKQ